MGVAFATAASGLLIGAASPASADSTYYACVKKKTGETKVVKKNKKCKKGWKKVSWSATGQPGATGPQGPAGPLLSVKDGTGAVVGPFMGAWSGLIPGFTVLIDGGLWTYQNNGKLSGDGWDSPSFTDATCSAAVRYIDSGSPEETAKSVARYLPNGPGRLVYRANTVGAATRAWKVSGSNALVVAGQNLYELDSSGNCQFYDTTDAGDVTSGDTLVGLAEVTPPADRPGPLTVG